MISKKFNSPDIQERWKIRKSTSPDKTAKWSRDEWSLWLRDGLELYANNGRNAFAPFLIINSLGNHEGDLDFALEQDIPQLVRAIKGSDSIGDVARQHTKRGIERELNKKQILTAFIDTVMEAATDKDFLQRPGAVTLLYRVADSFPDAAPKLLTCLLKSEAAGFYSLYGENLRAAVSMLMDMNQRKAGKIPALLLPHLHKMSDPTQEKFLKARSVVAYLKTSHAPAAKPDSPTP